MAEMHGPFYHNIFALVPHSKVIEVATMLKAIHAQENIEEARRKRDMVAQKLVEMNLGKAAEAVRKVGDKTFAYYSFPVEHWKRI